MKYFIFINGIIATLSMGLLGIYYHDYGRLALATISLFITVGAYVAIQAGKDTHD